MSAGNIARQWTSFYIDSGHVVDLAVGKSLNFVPIVDDQGSLVTGNGTKDMDVKHFLGGDGSYAEFNSGSKSLVLSGVTTDAPQKVATVIDDVTVSTQLNGTLILNKAGAIGVTLPTPVGRAGQWIEVMSWTAQAHTITAGANLIVGIADLAATTLTAPGAIGDCVKLVSDGTKWNMVAMYGVWVST